MPSKLSRHAEIRINERLQIHTRELLHILNSGHGKIIGYSQQSRIIHRLLWSPSDKSLIIVIQDVIDGTVLTVLTLELYRNTHGKNLTDNRIRHVINKMVHSGFAPAELWSSGDKDEYVTIYAHSAERVRMPLGRWRGLISSTDLSVLGAVPEFWLWVGEKINALGFPLSQVESVTAMFSGGDHQHISYKC